MRVACLFYLVRVASYENLKTYVGLAQKEAGLDFFMLFGPGF